jgi:hypothetical protein
MRPVRRRRTHGIRGQGWLLAAFVALLTAGNGFVEGQRTPEPTNPPSTGVVRVLPGPVDIVYADPANLMYSYGPSLSDRLKIAQANAATANISVTYSGFPAPAQAAFQAAVDIWANVIASPVPIRVNASFTPLDAHELGQASPSTICTTTHGVPNTYYAAALADKINGSAFCAGSAGASSEIEASFNSTFSDWDFSTDGTPVSGKYSFMTAVLHGLAHGLGFYGSMSASGGIGSFRSTPDVYDRFTQTGSGAALLDFANPSMALGAQLVSDNTFFNGAAAVMNNNGARPKLDTHFFTESDADNGFKAGSSYSHVDDALYSGTPNGLMTWKLAAAEVYTDPGPIGRGIFSDEGWGANRQFRQQGPKLVGTGAAAKASQGDSVSLSADGNTAIVGGNYDNNGVGAAWVWTRSGGVWTQQGPKLIGSGAVGNPVLQGHSVSLSADGTTAIVGGLGDNGYLGAAWVWTRSGGVWTQQGSKLVGSGSSIPAGQGFSVSLSADGNTAIVGGRNDNDGVGAAWVWTRSGGVWSQQGPKLVGSSSVGFARQGGSVSLSADGNTAIVGGSFDDDTGAAWVWTRSGGIWTQQGTKLIGSGAVGNANQGRSVCLSADGNTAIVTGNSDDNNVGAAWVWTRSGGVWTQQGPKLVGSGAVGNTVLQGDFVSLSADGNTAIVGGPGDNSADGAAWVWTRSGGVWTQQGPKLVGSGAVGNSAEQGNSVSLSADGNTAIVGGVNDDNGVGAAWVFAAVSPDLTIPVLPTGVTATAVSSTRVDVAWPTAAAATSYQIDRQAAGDGFSQIGTSMTSSFSDTTASADAAYLYRVRAVNASGVTSSSAADLATTVIFVDSPLTSGIFVKAVHLSQLRTAVNAVRLLAGLPTANFTDAATAGTAIRAVHVTELRSTLDAARGALGLSTSGYTDASLTGVAIKAVHFQELRDRVY